ncbi:MAG: indolepyruvate oxidoreductase subunit beta family protein [Burkholderiaceae bacterium]
MSGAQPGTEQPIKILILALGGEGGGVLARWLVEAGIRAGHVVQSTSIPGVAQRTGATSYYLEWLPIERTRLAGQEPVLCLSPMAGDLDLLVSSELLESARAAERGLPDPERTLVISSDSRTFTVAEKSALADGRIAESALVGKLRQAASELVLFDMQAAAREAGTVISSVMFGAICASGRLPLERAHCVAVIGADSRSAEASLRGFDLGARLVEAARAGAQDPSAVDAADALTPVIDAHGPGACAPLPEIDAHGPGACAPMPGGQDQDAAATNHDTGLPSALAQLIDLGMARLRDFQDEAYAKEFQTRVLAWAALERAMQPADPQLPISSEAARQLARWMAYEDVIRVADLKIRAQRFEALEREASAGAGGITRTWDYLKPGIDEIAAILPPGLAERLRRFALRRNWRTIGNGMRIESTGLLGLVLLRMLAGLRGRRRKSSRFADEMALIGRWDAALRRALGQDAGLAAAIAAAPSLIKGYSDTHVRGRGRFVQVLEQRIEADGAASAAERARAITRAVAAARADVQGIALARELGLPEPEPVAQPIRFMPRRSGTQRSA